MRRIDAKSLRGLAHPLRMRILEAIELDGPATSSTLAARLGENTGTISWHLRLLAEHGYLEEDTDRGTKRERWWRVPGRTVLDPGEFADDPETRRALDVYLTDLVERYYDRVRTFVAEDWTAEWKSAAGLSDWRDLRLTPEQLHNLNEELAAVIDRYTNLKSTEETAERVIVQLQSFPHSPNLGEAHGFDNVVTPGPTPGSGGAAGAGTAPGSGEAHGFDNVVAPGPDTGSGEGPGAVGSA